MTPGAAIVGLGMATVDVLTVVPRLPGPDDVIQVDAVEVAGGGPVATALVAAARLGTPCAIVGAVDGGEWGDRIATDLAAAGVDTAPLRRRTGRVAQAMILVEASSGRRSILYAPGTLDPFRPDEVPADLVRAARVLHLDGVHPEAAVAAARIAREAGVPVAFDGGAGGPWPGTDALLPLVDLLIVARDFARSVTGLADPLDAGPALATTTGAATVVITDGPNGAWSWDGRRMHHQPAFATDVVDTTGAGDAFHGGYLHAFAAGADRDTCLRVASAVGALACTRLGGRAGLPDATALTAFLASAP